MSELCHMTSETQVEHVITAARLVVLLRGLVDRSATIIPATNLILGSVKRSNSHGNHRPRPEKLTAPDGVISQAVDGAPEVVGSGGWLFSRVLHATSERGSAPIAGGDERRPVERVGAETFAAPIAENGQARFMHGIGGGTIAAEPALVKGAHPRAGGLVLYRPQAHDHRPDPRDLERSAKPEHAFPRLDLAYARVTRGEDGPLHAAQVQAGHLLRCEDAVVAVRAGRRAAVCASQGEAGEQQRVLGGTWRWAGQPTHASRASRGLSPPQASLRKNPCVARWSTRIFGERTV